ncbi:hypothetical protein CHARACLAT_005781 [Characodon lateralis]|uniref:Uncharacterized protein n=1 Tax=Characodon lateralis TaxID=208331 RepID=A0ABU7EKI4_9TELE|nr:hypothetical protein [Characodon lateralis]
MGPISSPPHSLLVAGVSGHWCIGGFSVSSAGCFGVCQLWLLARVQAPWLCQASAWVDDVSRGLGSLGPWLGLLRRRQLPAGPVGSSLQLPGASALRLLGVLPGVLLCSSLGMLQ